MSANSSERIDWAHSVPILLVHFTPLAALLVGVSWTDWALGLALYYIRMFFLSAGYHRYFAHRSYTLGRSAQFLMALGGTLAAQKGPLWWAANHRHHHKYSDTPEDVHSPLKGFWWSHMGWFMCSQNKRTRLELIKDFANVPELRWLDKYWLIPPTVLALSCFFIGGHGTLFIGFFLSTVILYHGTFSVNSLAHLIGRRRYATKDASRNSTLIALVTCGEGYHNNHHHCQTSVRQGFYWWEIDFSYYVLKVMAWLRIARKLRMPTAFQLTSERLKDGVVDAGLAAFDAARRAARVQPQDAG